MSWREDFKRYVWQPKQFFAKKKIIEKCMQNYSENAEIWKIKFGKGTNAEYNNANIYAM